MKGLALNFGRRSQEKRRGAEAQVALLLCNKGRSPVPQEQGNYGPPEGGTTEPKARAEARTTNAESGPNLSQQPPLAAVLAEEVIGLLRAPK